MQDRHQAIQGIADQIQAARPQREHFTPEWLFLARLETRLIIRAGDAKQEIDLMTCRAMKSLGIPIKGEALKRYRRAYDFAQSQAQ